MRGQRKCPVLREKGRRENADDGLAALGDIAVARGRGATTYLQVFLKPYG